MKLSMSRRVFVGYLLLCAAGLGVALVAAVRRRPTRPATAVPLPEPLTFSDDDCTTPKPQHPPGTSLEYLQDVSRSTFEKTSSLRIPLCKTTYEFAPHLGRWERVAQVSGYLRPALAADRTFVWTCQPTA